MTRPTASLIAAAILLAAKSALGGEGGALVLSETVLVPGGESVRVSIPLDRTVARAVVTVGSGGGSSAELVSPSGERTAVPRPPDGGNARIEVASPLPGVWELVLKEGDRNSVGLRDVTVTAVSPARLVAARDEISAVAATGARLAAGLTGIPRDKTQVLARITAPSGATSVVKLHDDGMSGDETAGDGVFSAQVASFAEVGPHRARMVALADLAPAGGLFRRECSTVIAVSGPLPGGLIASADGIELGTVAQGGTAAFSVNLTAGSRDIAGEFEVGEFKAETGGAKLDFDVVELPDDLRVSAGDKCTVRGKLLIRRAPAGRYTGRLAVFPTGERGEPLVSLPISVEVFEPKVLLGSQSAPAKFRIVAGGSRILAWSASLDAGDGTASVSEAAVLDSAGAPAPGVSLSPVEREFAIGPAPRSVPFRLKVSAETAEGEYTARISTGTARGASASASVAFTVEAEGLVLPESVDLGRCRVEDSASAEATVSIRSTRRMAVRVRPGDLTGPRGAVIPGRLFASEPKSVELGLGKTSASFKLSLAVPAEMPSGRYDGSLAFEAPGISAECPTRVEIVDTVLVSEPPAPGLPAALPGETVEGFFDLSVQGVGETNVRLVPPKRIFKPLRPSVDLPASVVQFSPAVLALSPGGKTRIGLSASIPAGAEDGRYVCELTARSRQASEIVVPVSITVKPVVPRPDFDVSTRELSFSGGLGRGGTTSRFNVTSNRDEPLQIAVTALKGDLAPSAELDVACDGAMLLGPGSGLVLQPRSTAEVAVGFRIVKPAEPGRYEIALILSTPGHTECVQLQVSVTPPPPREPPGLFSDRILPPAAMAGLLIVVALASLAWCHSRGMSRFVGLSAACHLVLFAASVPFMAGTSSGSAGAPARAVAINVLADVEDSGLDFNGEPLEMPQTRERGAAARTLAAVAPSRGAFAASPSEPRRPLHDAATELRPADVRLQAAAPSTEALMAPELPSQETLPAPVAGEKPRARVLAEADLSPVQAEMLSDARAYPEQAASPRDAPEAAIVGRKPAIESPEPRAAPALAELRRELVAEKVLAPSFAKASGPSLYAADALPNADYEREGSVEAPAEPARMELSSAPQERDSSVADVDRVTSFGFAELGPAAAFEAGELLRESEPPKLSRAGDPTAEAVPPESPDRPVAAAAKELKTAVKGPAADVVMPAPAAVVEEAAREPGAAGTAVGGGERATDIGSLPSRERPVRLPAAPSPVRPSAAKLTAERVSAPKMDLVAAPAGEAARATGELPSPAVPPSEAPAAAGAAEPSLAGMRAAEAARAAGRGGPTPRAPEPQARLDLVPAKGVGIARAFSEGTELLTAVSGPGAPASPARVRNLVEGSEASLLIGRVRAGDEWNVAPGALFSLVDEFSQRFPDFSMKLTNRSVRLAPSELSGCNVLYLTGKSAFALKEGEAKALGDYLRSGGCLWADDASEPGSPGFDESFRKAMEQGLPDGELAHLGRNHPVCRSAYDLRRVGGDYSLPPGRLYRAGFFEGIDIGGRTAVVYTRNAYGEGVALDPYRVGIGHPMARVSPRLLRECSTRVSLNVVAFFLGGAASAESARAGVGRAPIDTGDPDAPWKSPGENLRAWENFESRELTFRGASARVRLDEEPGNCRLEMSMEGEGGLRCTATRSGLVRLDAVGAVVLRVENRLASAVDLAIELTTEGGERYETAPVFVPPGLMPNLRIPLDRDDFRSTATASSRYDSAFPKASAVKAFSMVVYPGPQGGSVMIDDIRFEIRR